MNIQEMGKQLADSFKAFVTRALEEPLRRIAELEARKPEPGLPGKDAVVDYDLIAKVIKEKLEELVAAIPPAAPGKDAEVDYKLINEAITARVKAEVGDLPPAAPGKDAPPVDVEALRQILRAELHEEVDQLEAQALEKLAEAVAAIPPAPAGKDAPPVDVEAIKHAIRTEFAVELRNIEERTSVTVTRLVGEAVAQIPPAAPGKDAVIDEEMLGAQVQMRVDEAVTKAVAAIPPAPAGKDAEPVNYANISAEIAERVADVVASIPPAPAGRDAVVDYAALHSYIDVKVAAIPPAAPGKDAEPVDYTRVQTVIQEEVARIPRPQDGKSIDMEAVTQQIEELIGGVEERALERLDATAKALPSASDIAKMIADLVAKIPPAAPGKDAEPIHPDTLARMVLEEVRRAIADIPRARDGEPGRDALVLDVLPSIDPMKSYPRGTYAEHANGIVRSIRLTDPLDGRTLELAGWSVCVNGVASEEEEVLEEGRLIRRTTVYTNGHKFQRDHKTSIILYHDVWKEGEYVRGDVVTLSGSMWHCNKPTKDRPGTSDSWTMMVKHGAHAKLPDPKPGGGGSKQVRIVP